MNRKELSHWRPGILPRQYLEVLRDEGIIHCTSIDVSSIDLHLSSQGWEMKGSLKLKQEPYSVISNNPLYVEKRMDLSSETQLERQKTYVIQLQEHINATIEEFNICGQASGRSSIGRLDVLTRLIVDKCESYDTMPLNYSGPLYVEITPITFPIIVKQGVSLNQLRLFRGDPGLSCLSQEVVGFFGELTDPVRPDCRDLTLDLSPIKICDQDVIAFTTKKGKLGEFGSINLCGDAKVNPRDYFEGVPPKFGEYIKIKKDRFYILRSRERFKLPPDVGVYCQAITENIGEIRIHYAGFVHPGFGYYREKRPGDKETGTPLIFEVRGHTVDAFLRNGELMAKVTFYRTSKDVSFTQEERDQMQTETYHNQELQLSKYFEPWEM